jgi:hypothetical protein
MKLLSMIKNINCKLFVVFFTVIILLITSGCVLPWFNGVSENIVTSEPPTVQPTDLSPFQNIGCTWQGENYADCLEGSIPKKMGCDSLTRPSGYLGLLAPESQILVCSYLPYLHFEPDNLEAKGLYDRGCKARSKERLLVYSDGDYLLIRDLEDLRYNFTPINNSDQALGYAIAATGFVARYDFEDLKNYRILTDNLEETSVTPVSDGFEIVLYHHELCGCGPHTTFMQRVKVTTTGDVNLLASMEAFEDPEEDNLCVD